MGHWTFGMKNVWLTLKIMIARIHFY